MLGSVALSVAASTNWTWHLERKKKSHVHRSVNRSVTSSSSSRLLFVLQRPCDGSDEDTDHSSVTDKLQEVSSTKRKLFSTSRVNFHQHERRADEHTEQRLVKDFGKRQMRDNLSFDTRRPNSQSGVAN
ncbi:hypothetical protein F2P81_013301 [Scophthalmus maximus]|uniref:Uncharacterized protein n=1 Tax=Scophthalmus maximus TaxID=52904 RepID=A0A6A4SNI1_SCOMX|nr:hypothetical protein F2P81_013301 [Scophthalmus maximus]